MAMTLQEWELLAAAAAHQLAETREDRKVSRLDDIRARMRALEAEVAQLERFGDGTRFVDTDVIRFTKTHSADDGTSKSYTYAAIKTPAGWYMTGQHRKPQVTYDELITFITNYPVATDVQVAASWVSIDEVGDELTAARWGPPPPQVIDPPELVGDPTAGFVSPTVAAEKLRAKGKFLGYDNTEINTLGTPAPTAEQRDYEIK